MATIGVWGLWHLGCVTAACLADLGFNVLGLEEDEQKRDNLQNGKAPLYEPGLDELIKIGVKNKTLTFTSNKNHLGEVDYLWITFDTPVNDQDEAQVDFVLNKIKEAVPLVPNKCGIIISSQIPLGSTKILTEWVAINHPGKVMFCLSPENLRLGKALQVFTNPDRIVAGVRSEQEQLKFKPILEKISHKIEWMNPESAELTKHAINGFLANSIVFANELAYLCEKTGADPSELERGLKTEERIGPKAYLKAGPAYSGGTLARDIKFLGDLCEKFNLDSPLIKSIAESNNNHKFWVVHKLLETCKKNPKETTIGLLGLTYKPGTSTLRRSLALETAGKLKEANFQLAAYDPYVKQFPEEENPSFPLNLVTSLADLVDKTDYLILLTQHSEFLEPLKSNSNLFKYKTVIDPNGFLLKNLPDLKFHNYFSLGRRSQSETTRC